MKISEKQSVDTGMALTLICLLLYVVFDQLAYMPHLAILALLITMIWPTLLKPLAFLWFGFSTVLGGIMSKLLLSIIYCLILVPIGLLSRVVRKDPLQLKQFGKGNNSVFVDRQHIFDKSDLDHPY